LQNLKNIFSEYKLLLIIIIIAIFVRLYFQIGHVFSDDAYYSYLSHSLISNQFTNGYLGYPVFPLRIGQIAFTSFAFSLLGTSEFATLIFPFLISILNLIITYKLTLYITKNKNTALIAVILMALFPTDVVFATLNFPDLINVFFINLGIYFLLKSFYKKNINTALLGGAAFFLSMQFKENIYYIFILLLILLIYNLFRHKQLSYQILIGMLFIGINVLMEGFIYLLLHNDFFYRLTIISLNYQYSFYDFFPHTAQKMSSSKNYFRSIFDQIFLINGRAIFLRRFYIFLPIVASIQSVINFRKKEYQLLIFWFAGLAFLLIAFTTSFTEFKPLDLQRSWYIYPVLMPIIILSAQFISKFKKHVSFLLIIIYTLGSLIMCHHYETFFDKSNLTSLKAYLRENSERKIFTDHFTKYSVDLIRSYKNEIKSERILGEDFNFSKIGEGDWILYNRKHIDELKMQKYNFPDFSILNSDEYKKTATFRDFVFYEKIIQ
jgi:4-amino-4-deoxy-L-arabinose transferase-like glycosyltransferase